jgi:hypothetical protein
VKVGDKVRVKNGLLQGHIGVIVPTPEIEEGWFTFFVELERLGGYGFDEDELELVEEGK